LNWLRATYLFSSGSVRLKFVPNGTSAGRLSSYMSASIIPYSGPIESPSYINNNPPVELREIVKLATYATALASTGSVAQDAAATPLDITVPYYSDSPVTFNVFNRVLTDNSYSTIMLKSPISGDMYMSAGPDFALKFPMPAPPIVANLWAVINPSEASTIIFGDTTPIGWWDWIIGLVTSPITTVQTTITRYYQYVAIASGFYNNFVMPGTLARYGVFYV